MENTNNKNGGEDLSFRQSTGIRIACDNELVHHADGVTLKGQVSLHDVELKF